MPSERSRTYSSVAFQVPPDLVDDAAGILINAGALGCEVGKTTGRHRAASRGKPPVLLRAYFRRIAPATIKRLHATLQAAGMLINRATPEHRMLADPGWATMWQARFVPLRIGRSFLIVPPWEAERDPDRIPLVIRPGQAFGTGHHASTGGTLIALEELCEKRAARHALDVGTGSGILAIAMVKLGVADVTAIDTDAAALGNAEENAALNGVAGRIHFSTTPLESVRGRFGLIAANILSSTLIRMASDLKVRLRRHGHLVLAGISRREAESVGDAYVTDLRCVGWRNHGAWTTLIFQR